MTHVHTPSCHLTGVASICDDAACALVDAIEAMEGRVPEEAIEQAYRLLGAIEIASQGLSSLAEDVDTDDPEATETQGGVN